MARYYGVNNSELYGSNFSTVLADAPPPLDDTYEEDENEFVFPSEGKKSKNYNGETVTSSIKSSHSSDEKIGDQSKPDDSRLRNGEQGQNSVEEDDDFGDFASFADFGSAFGQENSSESKNWFTGGENNGDSPQGVKTTNRQQGDVDDDNDEFADFAAFQDNGSSFDQENIPNGGSEQENANTSDLYNCIKNGLGNRINSNNSSCDMDSEDDFGDFASGENTTVGLEGIKPKNNSTKIEPELENDSTTPDRTCAESDDKSSQVDKSCERSIAQCNGDRADENEVSDHGESTLNQTSESSRNIDENQENVFGTRADTDNAENVSNGVIKGEESKSLGNSAQAAQHDDNHTGDSSTGVPGQEVDQIESNVKDSIDTDKEYSESAVTSNDTNITNANLSGASICGHSPEEKTSPENSKLNDDDFGEFADFNDPPIRQPSTDDSENNGACNQVTPDSPGISASIAGKGNEGASLQGGDDDDDEFGDFGSFDKNRDQNCDNTIDLATVDSKEERLPTENNDGNDNDDNFGDFGVSNSEEKTLPTEDKDNDNFGDFGALNSKTKDSNDDNDDDFGDFGVPNSEEKTLPPEDQDSDDVGDFGAFNSGTKNSNNDDNDDFGDFSVSNSQEKNNDSAVKNSQQDDNGEEDFGEFGTFDSKTKDSSNDDDDDFGNFRTSNSEGKTLAVEDQKDDDFGAFDSSTKDSKKGNESEAGKTSAMEDQDDDDFGDFGAFDSSTNDTKKSTDSNDDFGDFGSFESSDQTDDSFGDFGAFDAQKDSSEKSDEFGSFSTFESKANNVPKGDQSNSNLKDSIKSNNDDKFSDFRTADSTENSQTAKNAQSDEFGAFSTTSEKVSTSKGSDDDFGDFSSGTGKEGSFQAFPASHSSVSAASFPKKNEDLKQRGTKTFSPGKNVVIKQVGDTISLCFVSEQRHISDHHYDVLSSRVQKGLQSNLGFWQQLERSDKEGRILFQWSSSFSQHKKLLSLMIRPQRPPPIQGGTILKPMVTSHALPFGGGLAGSMLTPEPSGKLPQFSSGLDFLEPVKGSQLPVQRTTQDKVVPQHSVQPEIGFPDLSFVLGNGLKRTDSKSDIKDNVSDTTSESSSLDLDFFAQSTTQPSEGKSEPKGLYEEDLMGLNIFTSSVEPQKLDSPKPQKASDSNKVWQRGGVTIPLTSQQSKAQLSAAAKSILDELEDLRFMTSSVLMFPLKSE